MERERWRETAVAREKERNREQMSENPTEKAPIATALQMHLLA